MTTSYTLDIYRTDDAIVIHDRPGGWKRAIFGLLLSLVPVFLVILVGLAAHFDPPHQTHARQHVEQQDSLPMPLAVVAGVLVAICIPLIVAVFGFLIFGFFWLFFHSLWRIGGHETILIDRDSIRHDWWCFWGRRSRILPRPPQIKTETTLGAFMTGGRFGVKIHLGKRQKWFGTRKIEKYLPSGVERKWLCDEIARFQQEVPVTQPVDETQPVVKGAFSDLTYGIHLLAAQELHGQRLVRVVPGSESAVTVETTDHLPPGVLQIRCVKCHRIVPQDHVAPEPLIAKCPHCNAVFHLSEMERVKLSKRSRLRIRRDEDSLEIVQRPLHTGMPLCMAIIFLIMDAGCVAFYLYLQRLFPGEDPLMFIREKNSDVSTGYGIVHALAVTHLLLILPLWAMFDHRRIRIDRETMQVSGLWLFLFRWKRTIPRIHVKRACGRVWEFLFRQARILCDKRSFYIGCGTEHDVAAMGAEINHFLYAVPPWPMEHLVFPPPEPAFLGGLESGWVESGLARSGSPEISLHCPGCGTPFAATSLDFPQRTAHCSHCHAATPLDKVISYPVNLAENPPLVDLMVEKSDDRLTVQYSQHTEKGMRYFNVGAAYLCMIMFGAMLFGIWYVALFSEETNTIGSRVFFLTTAVIMTPMIAFIFNMFAQEINSAYCDWTITVTRGEMTLEHRFKKRERTIVIPREKIVRVELNTERAKQTELFRLGTYPAGFFEDRMLTGGHVLLSDGTKQYLPQLSINVHKKRDTTRWLAATLNEFLASRPVR